MFLALCAFVQVRARTAGRKGSGEGSGETVAQCEAFAGSRLGPVETALREEHQRFAKQSPHFAQNLCFHGFIEGNPLSTAPANFRHGEFSSDHPWASESQLGWLSTPRRCCDRVPRVQRTSAPVRKGGGFGPGGVLDCEVPSQCLHQLGLVAEQLFPGDSGGASCGKSSFSASGCIGASVYPGIYGWHEIQRRGAEEGTSGSRESCRKGMWRCKGHQRVCNLVKSVWVMWLSLGDTGGIPASGVFSDNNRSFRHWWSIGYLYGIHCFWTTIWRFLYIQLRTVTQTFLGNACYCAPTLDDLGIPKSKGLSSHSLLQWQFRGFLLVWDKASS